MKVLAWGTYDLSKPRVRILLRGLREAGADLRECHRDVWGGAADKSQIKSPGARLGFVFAWLLAYPRLIWGLLREPRPDVIFVGYLGQFDVLVLWPFARLRGIPIAWDAFISLYNTVVEDRRMVGPRHPLALLLYAVEWLACRAADRVILDTRAHADYFVATYKVPRDKTAAVFVGVEPEVFPPCSGDGAGEGGDFTVLFYGQYIPLHGIDTIVRAARLLENEPIDWVLIGKGQEEERIAAMLAEHPLPRMQRVPWVSYEELVAWMCRADVCLGIFDDGDKASRVIPNKVFQILAAGRPLITRDSPAMRELVGEEDEGVVLVNAGSAAALAHAVELAGHKTYGRGVAIHQDVNKRFLPQVLGDCLLREFSHLRG